MVTPSANTRSPSLLFRNDTPLATDGPEIAPSSGPSVEAAMRFSKITGAVVEAILREPRRATARRPASAPICSAGGRSARQRVWRPSPARSIEEPSPATAPAEMPKLEARCSP